MGDGASPGPRGWAWPTHRDLKADHFLLADDHLALLDLDSLAAADPVLDPATLLAQFAGMPFRLPLSHEQVQALSQLFTDEYFAHVPRDWRRRLPIQYAGAALHVAAGFFRRQEPRWPEAVAALVGQARDALAGRVCSWQGVVRRSAISRQRSAISDQ